ncbi:MAG: hypothetical protein HYR60_32110 [Acidobacteria bacterium]|nr:hypothetical protein [Acidobacteriota bacterium]
MRPGIHTKISGSDEVRQFAVEQYVRPAQSRGERSFSVIVGDVHRALGFRNRVPLVCAALKSNKFLRENRVSLKQVQGPPSGLSTTVTITYEFEGGEVAGAKPRNPIWGLLGKGKEMFQALGGGEAFIQGERESLNRLDAAPARKERA